jgi:hypothetical protein
MDGLAKIMLRFVLTKQRDRDTTFLVIRQQFYLDGAAKSLRQRLQFAGVADSAKTARTMIGRMIYFSASRCSVMI